MFRIPSKIKVKDEHYKVSRTNRLKWPTLGEWDPSDMEIRINPKQSKQEKQKTFLHELLHAMDDAYNIKLTHKQVYKLEEAVFDFLKDNL